MSLGHDRIQKWVDAQPTVQSLIGERGATWATARSVQRYLPQSSSPRTPGSSIFAP
jgi:hypothetical protein